MFEHLLWKHKFAKPKRKDMKKPMMILAVASAVLFTACGEEKKEEGKEEGKTSENKPEDSEKKEDVLEGGVYNVSAEESHIMWESWNREKPEEHKHMGTINLSGQIDVVEGSVTGGMMEAHLETINATDLEGKEEQQKKLAGHLMSPDFFATEEGEANNPTIEILKVKENEAEVKITARGMSVTTMIPVTVTLDGDQLMASSGEFEVDFMPFEMPWFAQEKEPGDDGREPTYLNPTVKFSGLKIVASK